MEIEQETLSTSQDLNKRLGHYKYLHTFVGQRIPNIGIKSTHKTNSESAPTYKLYLLFSSNDCKRCLEMEIVELNKLYNNINGLQVFAICVDDDIAGFHRFKKRYDISFPILQDFGEIKNTLQIKNTPLILLTSNADLVLSAYNTRINDFPTMYKFYDFVKVLSKDLISE